MGTAADGDVVLRSEISPQKTGVKELKRYNGCDDRNVKLLPKGDW